MIMLVLHNHIAILRKGGVVEEESNLIIVRSKG